MNAGSRIACRPATSEDWPAIRALLQACSLPLAGAGDHLESFIVAADGTGITGCIGIERYGDAALLRSCAVDAAHRGRGIGVTLTAHAIAHAKEQGIGQLVLLTTTAENFFPRFGFSRIARDDVPGTIKRSVEFRSACPASACAMRLALTPDR